ncbi:MAG: hypothetical protein RIR62_1273 [Pseudomonadota bacterium]|jgi:hypothetical protein
MKPLHILVLSAFLPFAALAEASTDAPAATGASPVGPVVAADVVLADLLYLRRPVVVFADTPNDPNFIRQMELIAAALPALAERDVIVITDTDPAARSDIRRELRPRGFSLVLMDKDLRPVIRKPLPWDVREITNAIDKFPLRRQEIQQRNATPGG